MSGPGGQGWAISFNTAGQDSSEAIGIRSAEILTDPQDTSISSAGTSSQISWLDGDYFRENLREMTIQLDNFDQALVNTAKAISQNVNIVTLRQDFTAELVNVLKEGANLLALQTAQQLGTQSLAIASQANQAVLSLLG